MQNKGFEAAKKNVWDHEKCASVSGEFCKIIFMIRNNLVVGNEMLVTWKCNISANNLSCELPVHPQISQHLLSDTLHNAAATWGWKPCFHFADEDLFSRVWKTVLPAPFFIFSITKRQPLALSAGLKEWGVHFWSLVGQHLQAEWGTIQPKGIKPTKQNATAPPNQSCHLLVVSVVWFTEWNTNRDPMQVP